MKNPNQTHSRFRRLRQPAAFTLTETVIAIGVLAVLLTGFIAVFTPAAQGIRRAISSEQADRLTTTLEMEMATLRSSQKTDTLAAANTGFQKAFEWIKAGSGPDYKNAIFVYQYRGDPSSIREDGTPKPLIVIGDKEPGKGYIVQSMARRVGEIENGEDLLEQDLKAIEGTVFFIKPTQLVYKDGELTLSLTPGAIANADETQADDASLYKEAVIAFSAEFHGLPTKTFNYIKSNEGFGKRFTNAKNPIFTRNLAVRR